MNQSDGRQCSELLPKGSCDFTKSHLGAWKPGVLPWRPVHSSLPGMTIIYMVQYMGFHKNKGRRFHLDQCSVFEKKCLLSNRLKIHTELYSTLCHNPPEQFFIVR